MIFFFFSSKIVALKRLIIIFQNSRISFYLYLKTCYRPFKDADTGVLYDWDGQRVAVVAKDADVDPMYREVKYSIGRDQQSTSVLRSTTYSLTLLFSRSMHL